MSSNIDNGPTAAYNNPPINPQYYQPRRFEIVNITLGILTIVTTQVDHDYVVGQQVRLIVSQSYGSYQLNEVEGMVIEIPADNEVVLNIDSSQNVNPFIPSPAYGSVTVPQILAIGQFNSGQINTGRSGNLTFIPGSFINISPA